MYLQHVESGRGVGLGACVVPRSVALRHLVLTDADRDAIGRILRLGRAATVDEIRGTLTAAIRDGIALATSAAALLRRAGQPAEAGARLRRAFHEAFGVLPEFVPSWRPAGQRWDVGGVVRERLRCAAKSVAEGDVHFVAFGPLRCPFRFAWTPATWAVVEVGRHRMCIGERFWQAAQEGDADGLATTLLHEALHIYFGHIGDDNRRGRFTNSACYERFVLLANGRPVPPAVEELCAAALAPVARQRTSKRAPAGVAGLGAIGVPASATCTPDAGEVSASRTSAGLLTNDVEVTDRGVLVADFGVNARSVKASAKAALAPLLRLLEADDVTSVRITGFDDCMNAKPEVHRYLRQARARRVHALLGPKARGKVAFVGGAPAGTFFGPNTNPAERARNRSVLIEYIRSVDFPEETITAPSCTTQLMQQSLTLLSSGAGFAAGVAQRVSAAIRNAGAGRDDRFIRPGGGSMSMPVHWSGIKKYFTLLCDARGGGAALGTDGLRRALVELDQDIINGVEALRRAEQRPGAMQNTKAALHAQFRAPLDQLLKNKSATTYAGY